MASSFKIEIVSIGDRVSPGSYTLHSAFSKAANFLNGERLVAVVTGEVGRGPVNLVVSGLEPSQTTSLEIGEDSIILNGETSPFDRDKLYRSQIEAASIDRDRLEKNLAAFEKTLIDLSPPKSLAFLLDPAREADFTTSFEKEFVKRVKEAISAIFREAPKGRQPVRRNLDEGGTIAQGFSLGDTDEKEAISAIFREAPKGRHTIAQGFSLGDIGEKGIKKLKGLGFGLTPSGDDFNAGLLSALNLWELTSGEDLTKLKKSVFGAAKGKNPLSNSFLALARDGCFFERLKELILSLGGEDEDRVRAAAKPLIAHGETSGSDLGVGFLLTMQKTIPLKAFS